MDLRRRVSPRLLTQREIIPYLGHLADADWFALASVEGALVVEAAARVLAFDLDARLPQVAAAVAIGVEENLLGLLVDVHGTYLELAQEFSVHGGRTFPFYRRVTHASRLPRMAEAADEAVILGVMAQLAADDYDLDTPEQRLAFEALIRSTNALPDDASPEDAAAYLQGYDDKQLKGIATNVKGIYHELAWEQDVNTDGHPDSAALFAETNHRLTDAVYMDGSGDTYEVSLKTGSVRYVAQQVEAHPDVHFVVNEEAYQALHEQYPNVHLESSGLSDAEMRQQVQDMIEGLEDDPNAMDYIPVASLWSTVVAITPLIWRWMRGTISSRDCIKQVAKITGLKVAKVALLLVLLSNPITGAPTSIYLVAKVVWALMREYLIA